MTLVEIAERIQADYYTSSNNVRIVHSVASWQPGTTEANPHTLYAFEDADCCACPLPDAGLVLHRSCYSRSDATDCIVIPDEVPLSDAIQSIRHILEEEIRQNMYRKELLTSVMQHIPLEQYINLAARFLSRPLLFTTGDNQTAVASSTYPKKSPGPQSILLRKVLIDEIQVGTLSMVTKGKPLSEEENELFSFVCTLMVHFLHFEEISPSFAARHYSHLVELLLRDAPNEWNEQVSAAHVLNLSDGYRILVIKPDARQTGTSGLPYILSSLLKQFPDYIFSLHKNSIVLILSDSAASPRWGGHPALEAFVIANHLCMGISRSSDSSVHFRNCYQEAQNAIAIGTTMGEDQCIFEYETYAQQQMWNQLSSVVDLTQYIHPAIQFLLDYDLMHSTFYFPTLRSFLQNNGNQAATADELTLNKSTLRYRLEKIQDLAGIDLNDAHTCNVLSISLNIYKSLRNNRH